MENLEIRCGRNVSIIGHMKKRHCRKFVIGQVGTRYGL